MLIKITCKAYLCAGQIKIETSCGYFTKLNIFQDGSLHDIRESPDGANSSAIDATCKSSNGRASTSFDIDMADDFESVHEEDYCRDIIMEFVHMEGQPAEQRSSVRSPFKKYTNKLKNKVIKIRMN